LSSSALKVLFFSQYACHLGSIVSKGYLATTTPLLIVFYPVKGIVASNLPPGSRRFLGVFNINIRQIPIQLFLQKYFLL